MSTLPDGADPELWFVCPNDPHKRDYLLNLPGHTFPGRMIAWCEDQDVRFRVSKSELPAELPAATRYWVQGFLVGNVPAAPVDYLIESPAYLEWQANAEEFLATGDWPAELGPDDNDDE